MEGVGGEGVSTLTSRSVWAGSLVCPGAEDDQTTMPSQTSTGLTETETATATATAAVLRLRLHRETEGEGHGGEEGGRRRRVVWAEDTIDNENCGRKSSKSPSLFFSR